MEPFLGQITLYACNFAPYGWLQCQGQILPIQQYAALFSLLGTNFGGNGTSNFSLPNLQSTVPIGQGQGAGLSDYVMGETGGSENVSLTLSTMPAHSHPMLAYTATATATNPAGALTAKGPSSGGHGGGDATTLYSTTAPNVALAPGSVGPAGGNIPHSNLQPLLALNWCIATTGVFPTRS